MTHCRFVFVCIIICIPPPPHSASCNVYLLTSVHILNALVLQGKTPPAQVAAGDDYHECKWSV